MSAREEPDASAKLHRGRPGIVRLSGGTVVRAGDLSRFLGAIDVGGHGSARAVADRADAAPTSSIERTTSVSEAVASVTRDAARAPVVSKRPWPRPIAWVPRIAVLPLTDERRDAVAALALALADRLCRATTGSVGIVTLPRAFARVGRRPRRPHKESPLSGFEPLAAVGKVAVLDAEDAPAASIVAVAVPMVSVVTADPRSRERLAAIHPVAVTLVAGAKTSESYLSLACSDLASSLGAADVFAARWADADPAFDGAMALAPDPLAALRLRPGLPPSRAARDNAEQIARRVLGAGS